MKKWFFLFSSLLAIGGAVRAQNDNISDPNVELRDAKNFTSISVSGPFAVYLSVAEEEKVAVSCSDARYTSDITVEVKNGVLEIGMKEKFPFNTGTRKWKAYISCKSINHLSVGGAANIHLVGTLKAPDLTVNLANASDMNGRLEVDKLTVELRNASDARLTGTAKNLSVVARQASSFKGYDLVTDYCVAEAANASDVKITVNKELSAKASSASDINYKGEAVIRDIDTRGASSIAHKS